MKFLAEFASSPSLKEFRLAEFLAVSRTLQIDVKPCSMPVWCSQDISHIFLIFECDSILNVRRIANRCILLRSIYILFYASKSIESICSHFTNQLASSTCEVTLGEDLSSYLHESYNYQVESFGRKYSVTEKGEIVDHLCRSIPHRGQVTLTGATHRFYVLMHHASKGDKPCILFGKLAANSSRCPMLSKYDLKKRPYIGTTSMPPEESIAMANLCHIAGGMRVYDPFCGTGSILVAAAHFGAHTFGTDFDGRTMRAGSHKSHQSPQMQQQRELAFGSYSAEDLLALEPSERVCPSMTTNFKLYGLRIPERMRFNFSTWERSFKGGIDDGAFDAIVTDPPYGLREPRKKVNVEESSSSGYSTLEVSVDLVCFAAKHLVVGGCLAFWHPTTDNYTDDELPQHPSMRVLVNVPQRLSLKVVRRLIIMEKVQRLSYPPPEKSLCCPKKAADDLRGLMDATEVTNNPDYMHYRERVDRRKCATSIYLRSLQNNSEGNADSEARGNRRGRKNLRSVTQEQVVANRARNIRKREEKQALSNQQARNHTNLDSQRCDQEASQPEHPK